MSRICTIPDVVSARRTRRGEDVICEIWSGMLHDQLVITSSPHLLFATWGGIGNRSAWRTVRKIECMEHSTRMRDGVYLMEFE